MDMLKLRDPASLEICALLQKRQPRSHGIPIKYLGREIPDTFVVGYGLDYDENYRNLPFVAGYDRPVGR
jgi:hypoxanthine phosphoribosyltransferase